MRTKLTSHARRAEDEWNLLEAAYALHQETYFLAIRLHDYSGAAFSAERTGICAEKMYRAIKKAEYESKKITTIRAALKWRRYACIISRQIYGDNDVIFKKLEESHYQVRLDLADILWEQVREAKIFSNEVEDNCNGAIWHYEDCIQYYRSKNPTFFISKLASVLISQTQAYIKLIQNLPESKLQQRIQQQASKNIQYGFELIQKLSLPEASDFSDIYYRMQSEIEQACNPLKRKYAETTPDSNAFFKRQCTSNGGTISPPHTPPYTPPRTPA